jgi:GNAT superfamily N-acetyltransferase
MRFYWRHRKPWTRGVDELPAEEVAVDDEKTAIVSLRALSESDFESVLQLLHQLWPQSHLDVERLKATYRCGLLNPSVRFVGAEAHSQLVGFCSLSVRQSLWQHGQLAHCDELVVDEEHRGKGIGAKLLDHVVTLAAAMGCSRIELDSAFHRTQAHRFYAKLGFENRAFLFSKPIEPASTNAKVQDSFLLSDL